MPSGPQGFLRRVAGIISAVTLCGVMVGTPAGSAALGQALGNGRHAVARPYRLTVYPARVEIPATDSFGVVHRLLHVYNQGTSAVHVQVALAAFTQSTNGQVNFIRPDRFSAASWVDVSPVSFSLAPRQSIPVQVRINVPAHPEPGERYVGVLFKVPPGPAQGNVRVAGAIGVEMLINVPGPVRHHIALGALQAPTFVFGRSVPLTLTVRNRGNVHHDFLQRRRLTANIEGSTVRFPNFTVLRDSARVIQTNWINPPLFCICHASVSTGNGHGRPTTARTTFVVFPLVQVLGILVAVAGLLLIVRSRIQRSKPRTDDRD